MQKTKLLLTSLTLTGLLALAGCSFPGVYKIDIQQGNVVTQDMIDQLRPGMTRRQVRFIMGNPLLTDTFHANRWDYLYSIQPGGGERLQERVSVIFDGNDPEAVNQARAQWKALTDAGCAAQYWSEESERWEKKAERGA